MHTTDLGGHSGCQILLCETEENLVFVRKISSNIEYNQRLINRQKNKVYLTPQVLKHPKYWTGDIQKMVCFILIWNMCRE